MSQNSPTIITETSEELKKASEALANAETIHQVDNITVIMDHGKFSGRVNVDGKTYEGVQRAVKSNMALDGTSIVELTLEGGIPLSFRVYHRNFHKL